MQTDRPESAPKSPIARDLGFGRVRCLMAGRCRTGCGISGRRRNNSGRSAEGYSGGPCGRQRNLLSGRDTFPAARRCRGHRMPEH